MLLMHRDYLVSEVVLAPRGTMLSLFVASLEVHNLVERGEGGGDEGSLSLLL